jgi:hypothetical protein
MLDGESSTWIGVTQVFARTCVGDKRKGLGRGVNRKLPQKSTSFFLMSLALSARD